MGWSVLRYSSLTGKARRRKGSQTIRRMQPAIVKPQGSGARLLYDWMNNSTQFQSRRKVDAIDEYRKMENGPDGGEYVGERGGHGGSGL